jgi:uncharacterized protein (DUF1697 family)
MPRYAAFLRGVSPLNANTVPPVSPSSGRQAGRHLLRHRAQGRELFTAHVPGPKGAPFMALIERAFGKAITTRTWETVARVARA